MQANQWWECHLLIRNAQPMVISWKRCMVETWSIQTTNKKSHTLCRLALMLIIMYLCISELISAIAVFSEYWGLCTPVTSWLVWSRHRWLRASMCRYYWVHLTLISLLHLLPMLTLRSNLSLCHYFDDNIDFIVVYRFTVTTAKIYAQP